MRSGVSKWVLALAVSGVVHAGVAFFLLSEPEAVEISGGGAVEIALAGNAFTDQVAAGEVQDTIEPVSHTAEVEAEAITAEATEAAPLQAAQPVEQSAAPAAESIEVSPVGSIGIAAERPEEVQPNETALAVSPAPQENTPTENPRQEIKPDTPSETVTALANVPVPTPRPHYEPLKAKPKKPEPQQARQPVKRQAAGSNGQGRQDSKRGTSRGAEQAVAARQGSVNARANTSGNAAISNYPGKIVAKLRRSLRYPSEARRQRLRGEVHVRFIVTQGGGVGGISVVRSSGSPVLDRAAVETVQRAAPFPTIPAGAGRTSWPFTVPLAFTR